MKRKFGVRPRISHFCENRGLTPIFLLLAMMPSMAVAGGAAEATGLAKTGIEATIELRNFWHFHSVAEDDWNRNEIRLDLEYERKLTDWLKADIKVRAQGDDGGLTDDVVIEIPDNRRHRSRLDIQEVELAAKAGAARFYIGRRIYSWGSADVYNPTDRLNSHDWLDPVDAHRNDDKLGAWSLAATTTVRDVQLEAVWVPFFSPSRLPHLDSRWVGLDREGLAEEFPELADDYDDFVRFAHAPTPDRHLGNSQFGVRAKTTIAGWDAALSYYDGYFDLPELDLRELELRYPRIHVPGLSVSTSFGNFELHSETAFVIGGDGSSGSRVETVNGLNWYIDPIPLLRIERAMLVLEYLRVDTLSRGAGYVYGVVQRAHPLLQNDGIASRLELVFSEDTSLNFDFLMASHADPSFYFGPRVVRRLGPDLEVSAGFDTFFGDRDTALGHWKDNSRFFTTVRWTL
jgi:hypothetical protein